MARKETAVLVLTRKVGERILIGDNIMITVLKKSGGRVKLGIEAPGDVGIRREELPSQETDEEPRQ